MNIYMYTVYTYLSVDIYECMSNVSITCRYRQYVLYIMLYLYMLLHSFCSRLTTCTLMFTYIMYMYSVVCDCDVSYHNCAEVAYDSRVFFFFKLSWDAEACDHRVY